MKKLIIIMILVSNISFLVNANAFDCDTACGKVQEIQNLCQGRGGVHGGSYAFKFLVYCDCRCANSGEIIREIGPCSLAFNHC